MVVDAVEPVVSWILGASVVLFLVAVVAVSKRLGNSDWSIAEALSEEAEGVTALPVAAPTLALAASASAEAPGVLVPAATTVAPARRPVMLASTSRLIALFGMLGNMTLFMAYGFVSLWFAGKGVAKPELIDQLTKLMTYGLVMFAPYTVNKFSTVFDGLLPKRG